MNSVCVCGCYRNDQSVWFNTEIRSAPSSINPVPYIKYVIFFFLKHFSLHDTSFLQFSHYAFRLTRYAFSNFFFLPFFK